jgi:YVTN family beta-propeller protein
MKNKLNHIKAVALAFSAACTLTVSIVPAAFADNPNSQAHRPIALPKISKSIGFPPGSAPEGIAFNKRTNRVYIYNRFGDNISVLDGKTDQVLATIPDARLHNNNTLAVDEKTNRIYAAIGLSNGTEIGLLEIDGKTNQPVADPMISLGDVGGVVVDIKINQKTRKMYAAVFYGTFNGLVVVDLKTRQKIGTIPVQEYAYFIAINEETNKIYANDGEGFMGQVSVIDGKTDTLVKTLQAGDMALPEDCFVSDPFSCTATGSYLNKMAVNTKTNTIYVPAMFDNRVIVIDGKTDTVVESIPVGFGPTDVAVDDESNQVYVANNIDASVSVIDGRTSKSLGKVSVGTSASPAGCWTGPVFFNNPCADFGSWTRTVGFSERTNKVYALNSKKGDNAVVLQSKQVEGHD